MNRSLPVCAAAFVLLAVAPVQAHRLEGEYKISAKEKKVAVESWFENGDSPKSATVQVFRSDKRLLVEGKLNDKGVFVFSFEEPDTLRIVISAPGGHRKELTISRKELETAHEPRNPEASKPPAEEAASPIPESGERFADRSAKTTVKDVLIGLSALLALAGFVLGMRNARELREIRQGQR